MTIFVTMNTAHVFYNNFSHNVTHQRVCKVSMFSLPMSMTSQITASFIGFWKGIIKVLFDPATEYTVTGSWIVGGSPDPLARNIQSPSCKKNITDVHVVLLDNSQIIVNNHMPVYPKISNHSIDQLFISLFINQSPVYPQPIDMTQKSYCSTHFITFDKLKTSFRRMLKIFFHIWNTLCLSQSIWVLTIRITL